jgi:hypothetical protein
MMLHAFCYFVQPPDTLLILSMFHSVAIKAAQVGHDGHPPKPVFIMMHFSVSFPAKELLAFIEVSGLADDYRSPLLEPYVCRCPIPRNLA